MKVLELIEELKQYNQDADIYVLSNHIGNLALQTFDNEDEDIVFISSQSDEELVA